MIGIVDYGVGNLHSVLKGFETVGLPVKITADPSEVVTMQGLVLPGVGAFADAMANLKATGMQEAVLESSKRGIPVLGICLGMQLLFTESKENGVHQGLNLIEGRVLRFPQDRKVPHMGWNQLKKVNPSTLLKDIPDLSYFYFVHSYYCQPARPGVVIGTCDYGVEFACAVQQGNVMGLQFHPEKSSVLGLRMLKNFGEMLPG